MTKIKIAVLIFFFFFLANISLLPHYGINWDEPLHFSMGQAFLRYFLSGKKDYNGLPEFQKYFQKEDTIFYSPVGENKDLLARRSLYQNSGYEFDYWAKVDERGHPPLSGIMAALFNYIFFQKLGLINDIDSHNLYVVFTASILVAAIFLWVSKRYGLFAGLIATLSLILYPLFTAELHFNIKDIPQTVFYSLTIITFYEAIINRKTKWLLASAIFFGVSLATKFNILFSPLILISWLGIYIIGSKIKVKKFSPLIPALVFYPLISFAIFVLSWPVMWESPIRGFLDSLMYYKKIGITSSFDWRFLTFFGFNTYPGQWIFYTTPVIILFFTLLAFIYLFKRGLKEKNRTSVLIFLWFILPIIRVSIPNASIYGGVRQIMEYIPAMAILSGIGVKYLVEIFQSKFKTFLNRKTLQLLIVLSFLPITLRLISLHPNEGVYFNWLAGGLKGAKIKDIPYWGETLGNPYKQGLTWINKNAKENAKLVLTYGMGANLPSIFIRPDINFHNGNRGYDYMGEEYAIGLTHKNNYENTYYLKYLEKFLTPVYEVKVDEVPILKIWKNDLEHTRPEYREESLFAKKIKSYPTETGIVFDLGEKAPLRKLKLFYQGQNCLKNAQEINLQISQDQINWEDTEDSVGKYILEVGMFYDPSVYIYYFTGEPGRYIKIDFKVKESCLNYLTNAEVYTLFK